MLLSGRAAQRMFFAITPFMCFMAGYLIVKLLSYSKKSKENYEALEKLEREVVDL